MIHDEPFWKDCFRDALREIVRAEGLDALRAAPHIRRVCEALASEADLALHEAREAQPKCPQCRGFEWVFDVDEHGNEIHPGRPCPACNRKTEPAPPVAASGHQLGHG